MRRKNKEELDEFAQNLADGIFENFPPEQHIDVTAAITKKIMDKNVRRLVQGELDDMNKYLEKRFGIKLNTK